MNVLLPLIIVGVGFFNNVETPELVTFLASNTTESEAVPEVTEQEVAESWSHLTPSTRKAILMLVEADQMTRIE
jgi:hypothetical protein